MVEFICKDANCVNNDFVTEWPEDTVNVTCVCGTLLTAQVK